MSHPRRASKRHGGRRVQVNRWSHEGPQYEGQEGVLVEKTNDSCWPYKVLLDSGEELSLEDWQFDYIGQLADKVQPVQVHKVDRVESEVVMARTSTKRVPIKGRAKTTNRERVAPARGKATEGARKATKAKGTWANTILDLGGYKKGSKIDQRDFLNDNEDKLAKMFPANQNLASTVRQTLQGMVKAKKIARVFKDGEMVEGVYKVL